MTHSQRQLIRPPAQRHLSSALPAQPGRGRPRAPMWRLETWCQVERHLRRSWGTRVLPCAEFGQKLVLTCAQSDQNYVFQIETFNVPVQLRAGTPSNRDEAVKVRSSGKLIWGGKACNNTRIPAQIKGRQRCACQHSQRPAILKLQGPVCGFHVVSEQLDMGQGLS